RVVGRAGGHRIRELFLDHRVREQAGGDASCVGFLADTGVVSDDVGPGDEPGGLEGDQLWVAGTDADTVETTGHSSSLASALRADEVIAEPPRRPRVLTWGISMPCRSAHPLSACLDSAAPTKPTGQPTIAAGRGAPSI